MKKTATITCHAGWTNSGEQKYTTRKDGRDQKGGYRHTDGGQGKNIGLTDRLTHA